MAALLLAVPLTAAACSGGGGAPNAGGRTTSTVPAAASSKALPLPTVCKSLKSTFASGPDPATNPVGFARAQLFPLTEVRTSDQRLLVALRSLVQADHDLIAAKGHDAAASDQITAANHAIDAVCPGVTR